MPSFLISSSITGAGVIFVFASLFPYSLSLIANVFVVNYDIDCFIYLVIAYIHHSAHILFVYKLVLVLLKFGV